MDNYFEYLKEVAITVCDKDGKILDMNTRSADVNSHGQKILAILKDLLENEKLNAYTIEKNGVKKLIYQVPWYDDGKFGGLIEFSIPIPFEMPHYVRTLKQD